METDEERIVESTRKIYRLYHDNVNVEEAVKLMRNRNISANFVKSIYYQLYRGADNLMTERFNYFTIEASITTYFDVVSCWTSRYLLAYRNQLSNFAFHEITIFDVFNDKSIEIVYETNAHQLDIYPLKDGLGLLKEHGDGNSFISLIFLDLCERSLQKLYTVEYSSSDIDLLVNKADSTTFILDDPNNQEESKICKIVDKTIIIGDVVEIDFYPDCFYDKSVYFLNWKDENEEDLDIPQMYIYNVEEKTQNQFDLDLPVGYNIDLEHLSFVHNSFFVELISQNNSRVIGCFNIQTRKWNILEFYLNLSIKSIDGFEQGNLIVQTFQYLEPCFIYHFCKISFGNPESLENMAWLRLVKSMKKRKTVWDAYEAAQKYLPSNSSINCPFNRSDKDEPEKKRIKLK